MTSTVCQPARFVCLGSLLLLATALSAAPAETEAPEWIEGRGQNEVVLIHGLGASNEIWQDLTPYIVSTFNVFLYELHGHGQTPPLRNPTIAAEAAALRAWIEEKGLIYPTLVGHGMGGMIAMQYTFDHPGDVQRLIVIDAGPRQLASDEQKAQVARALLDDYDRFVAAHYLDISFDSEINDLAVDMALRTDSASFASLLLSSFDWDLTDRLPRQSVPMLVIGSESFLPVQGEESTYLEQYGFSNARALSFKRVEKTGHYLMLENPTYLASVLVVYILQEDFE